LLKNRCKVANEAAAESGFGRSDEMMMLSLRQDK
jgi:hypothetical protein